MSYQTRAGGRVTLTEAKREHYARVPTVTVSKYKRWAADKAKKLAAKALHLPDLEIAWYRSYPESIIRADAALERLSRLLGDPWEKMDSFTSEPGGKAAGMVRFEAPGLILLSSDLPDRTKTALVTLHEARHVWQIRQGHLTAYASSPWTHEQAEEDADDWAVQALVDMGGPY